jgi:uncharacterized protein (DUF433 family)
MNDLLDRITIESEKLGGQPCIRGLRLRVGDVLEQLSAGASNTDVLIDYPFLEEDDIRACLLYAARLTSHPVISAA